MGTFEDLGKRLDRFADQVLASTSSGIERTASETKEWRKVLDEIADKMRRTTQGGVERIAQETKDLGQSVQLRSRLREKKKRRDEKLCELGRLVLGQSGLDAVDEENVIVLRAEIAAQDAEIERIESELQNLGRD